MEMLGICVFFKKEKETKISLPKWYPGDSLSGGDIHCIISVLTLHICD